MPPPDTRKPALGGDRLATAQDFKPHNATKPTPGKRIVFEDRSNASVMALAVKLGVFADMAACIREHRARGPHIAVHVHPQPVQGHAVALMLFGGFTAEADNGWLCYVTPDTPGSRDYLAGIAARCMTSVTGALQINHGRGN